MKNLPEQGNENINKMKELQSYSTILDTPDDLVEWMLTFLSSTEISEEEWLMTCHSEVHILIPTKEE
ncbi:hypothetical protein HP456_15515 [Bacillus haikouensis]|jgi:hypothetical protein|uniref:hypothetical protein n=1 Tax=Bacillus haikouensis TaxID=1510468 RepID=UPI0015538C9C|nr:hypothetical protein [Bacillus haikouensis]NQD67324.1 hypothetical protein [Bacillus haikouensis]